MTEELARISLLDDVLHSYLRANIPRFAHYYPLFTAWGIWGKPGYSPPTILPVLAQSHVWREIFLKDIALFSDNNETSTKLLASIQEETLIQLMDGKNPVLVETTVPRKPTYYVERKLETKFQSVSPNIFKYKATKDVFLVANITRLQFANMIEDQNAKIFTSTQFIRQLKDDLGRFVILDSKEHFNSVCQKTEQTKTVHLLKFSNENKCLNWIQTRGKIELVRKYAKLIKPENQSEKSCLEEIEEKRFICIADTPGMGKSNILYSLAEKIAETNPTRLTLFFVLSELINKNINDIRNSEMTHEKIVQILVNNSKSKLTKKYVETTLSSQQNEAEINIEIMFDGLDEVSNNYLEEAKRFIKNITEKLKCARVWLTTRPHLMDDVEKEFSTLSVTISPFSEDDQLDFLTRFWRFEEQYEERTKIFGNGCIDVLQKNIESKFERSMSGIPLQCMLLAEVFKERGSEYVKSDETELNINFESITNLYERLCLVKMKIFVRKQGFENVGKFEETYIAKILLKRMELIHMRMAVELLCPEWLKVFEPFFDSVTDASDDEICAYGLVEHISNKSEEVSAGILRFCHRTIAEFFVALLQIRLGTNAYPSKQISEETRGTLVGKFISGRLMPINVVGRIDLNIVMYFWDKLLSDKIITLISRNHYTKCELKNELPYQYRKGSCTTYFSILCIDFIHNNLLNILKLLVSCLDSTELEHFLCRVKSFHLYFINLAIQWGTLQMVEYLAPLFSQGNGNYIMTLCLKHNLNSIYGTGLGNVEQKSPIGHAIKLGKYDIAEYLMNHHGLTPDVWDTLRKHFRYESHIHELLLNSNQDTSNKLSDKIKFIENLSSFQGAKSILNGNRFEITPILEANIAPELIQCLLECGASIHVNSAKHGTVLHHVSKMKLLRGYDYNSMVDSCRGFGLDVTALNSNLETALEYAVINDTIRLSRNTITIFLDLFSELQIGLTCKQIFSKITGTSSSDEIHKIRNFITYAMEKDKLLKARDFDGNTAVHMLMMAKFMNNTYFEEILIVLLKCGLNPEETNYKGNTPFQTLFNKNNFDHRISILLKFPEFHENTSLTRHNEITKLFSTFDDCSAINLHILNIALSVSNLNVFVLPTISDWSLIFPATVELLAADIRRFLRYSNLQTTTVDIHGNTLLHYVFTLCTSHFIESFLTISDENAMLIKNNAGDEPILRAVVESNIERVHLMTNIGKTKSEADCDFFGDKLPLFHTMIEKICENQEYKRNCVSEKTKDVIKKALEFLLDNGCSVNSQNISGTTLLHIATGHELVDSVKRLVEIHHAKVNVPDNDRNTPLHYAVKSNYMKMIDFLLKNGADSTIRNNSNLTPLQFTICSGAAYYLDAVIINKGLENLSEFGVISADRLEEIEQLLSFNEVQSIQSREFIVKYGGRKNYENDLGQNLFHVAAIHKYIDMIHYDLSPFEIFLNQQDHKGNTPLHYACKTPLHSMIKSLLLGGAEINLRNKLGQTPLEFAIENGTSFSAKEIRLFIRHRAHLDSKFIKKYVMSSIVSETPLPKKYLKQLKFCGVNIHKLLDADGASLQHLAVKSNKLTYLKELIQDLQFNIHATDINSNTLLHYAMLHLSQPQVYLMYLLQNKIDHKAENSEGFNALDYAFVKKKIIHPDVMKIFLDHDVQPNGNIWFGSLSPLFISVNTLTLRELYKIESHVNRKDEKTGCTFIHDHLQCKITSNSTDFILEYLVENFGACVKTPDNEGNTPLHYALRFRNNYDTCTFQVTNFLLFHGADVSAMNNSKLTPLMYMLDHVPPNMANEQRRDGFQNLLIFLIDSGADPEALHPKTRDTLLHSCAKLGLHKGVRYLVEQKNVEINSKNCHHKTPFHLAVENASEYHHDITEYFIEKGCQLNPNSFHSLLPLVTLLQIDSKWPDAILSKRTGALEKLFRKGSYSRDEFCSIAKFWIEKGCNIHEKFTPYSRTLLHVSFWNSKIDLLIPLKYLVNLHKIDVNARDEFGNSALHYAVQLPSSRERNKVLRFLTQNGADASSKNKIGLNPISYLFHIIHHQIYSIINENNAMLDMDEYLPVPETVREGYRKGVKSGKAEDAFNECDLISVLRIFKDSQVDLNETHLQEETIIEKCLRTGLPNVTRFLISILGSIERVGDAGSDAKKKKKFDSMRLAQLAENCFFHAEKHKLLYHLKR